MVTSQVTMVTMTEAIALAIKCHFEKQNWKYKNSLTVGINNVSYNICDKRQERKDFNR